MPKRPTGRDMEKQTQELEALNVTEDIAFEDLFIIEDIQRLQDEFASAT